MIIADLELLRLELFLRLREQKEIVWRTKEGVNVPINDMTDKHLLNTIKMLEREEIVTEMAYEALSSTGDIDF